MPPLRGCPCTNPRSRRGAAPPLCVGHALRERQSSAPQTWPFSQGSLQSPSKKVVKPREVRAPSDTSARPRSACALFQSRAALPETVGFVLAAVAARVLCNLWSKFIAASTLLRGRDTCALVLAHHNTRCAQGVICKESQNRGGQIAPPETKGPHKRCVLDGVLASCACPSHLSDVSRASGAASQRAAHVGKRPVCAQSWNGRPQNIPPLCEEPTARHCPSQDVEHTPSHQLPRIG